MSANLGVEFVNRSQGAATYLWKFGDGTTSTEASPEHTYLTGGAYVVTLVATGVAGVAETSRAVIGIGTVADILLSTAEGDGVATADGDFITVPPP